VANIIFNCSEPLETCSVDVKLANREDSPKTICESHEYVWTFRKTAVKICH